MAKVWIENDTVLGGGYYECTECGRDADKCGCYPVVKKEIKNIDKELAKIKLDYGKFDIKSEGQQ